jgi:hypothetical protein
MRLERNLQQPLTTSKVIDSAVRNLQGEIMGVDDLVISRMEKVRKVTAHRPD